MFSGLGGQYLNMGLGLYRKEPVFRDEMDRCFDILKSLVDYDIKEVLYPGLHPPTAGIDQPEIEHVPESLRIFRRVHCVPPLR